MEDCDLRGQDGNAFADDMLQLLSRDSGQFAQSETSDCSVLPRLQALNHQPSLGRLQQQTALQLSNWPASRASGSFTGPPIETGATLPYREPPRLINHGVKGLPTVSHSRSVTSGARQLQASLHPAKPPLVSDLQPTVPMFSSEVFQPQHFPSAHSDSVHPEAQAGAQAATPHLVTGEPSQPSCITQQNMASATGTHSANLNFDLPLRSALAPAGFADPQANSPSQMHMIPSPFLRFVLRGSDHAGSAACANEQAYLSQPLDSLNSTASKIRSRLGAGSDMDAADSDPVDRTASPKGDAGNGEEPADARHLEGDISQQPQPQQEQQLRQQPHGGHHDVSPFGEGRPESHSNQSTLSKQDRHQQQLDAGRSGSDGYHYAWASNKAKDMPDGGSDSAHTFSKDGKRGRGDSPGMQGSADNDPTPHAKKAKAQAEASGEDTSDGPKVTEAERRRIRRRVTNRESAKRIRDKREDQMILMSEKVIKLEAHKAELVGHMHRVEDCCAQLMQHLKVLKEKWCATCVENVKLYKKIFELRKALNPGAESSHLAGQDALAEEAGNLPASMHAAAAAAVESDVAAATDSSPPGWLKAS